MAHEPSARFTKQQYEFSFLKYVNPSEVSGRMVRVPRTKTGERIFEKMQEYDTRLIPI